MNELIDAEPESPQPLAYVPAANVVSVRGFRLLIILTLLNTTLLGGFVLGPALSGFARQQWADYQQRKADAKAEAAKAAQVAAAQAATLANHQKQLDGQAAASALVLPADTLLFDDDPKPRDTATTRPAPWPQTLATPRPYADLLDLLPVIRQQTSQPAIPLFVGVRRASLASKPRLVVVVLDPHNILTAAQNSYDARYRRFFSMTFSAADTDGNGFGSTQIASFTWRSPEPERYDEQQAFTAPTLRLFAGRADADDPARLVIPYEVAGVAGVIRGQLQGDDTLRLVPDRPLADGWLGN